MGRREGCKLMRVALKKLSVVAGAFVMVVAASAAWEFPYATDDPLNREDALREFYEMKWGPSSTAVKQSAYTDAARDARTIFDIPGRVRKFVETFELQDARILDVGSGAGYLQDTVSDYTGIDIASSAARFYHKPFVAGTATAMPFEDDAFDAAWSIWVLEHIPNPEAALSEIRRVVRPGGLIYMAPAWHCKPWAAEGYEARPYSDFGVGGKLIKGSIPLRSGLSFWLATIAPARVVRSLTSGSGPTRLHYGRLTPNYEEYWQADSDAVNSLDSFEMALWFESRGDTCLNCLDGWKRYLQPDAALVIRIGSKTAATAMPLTGDAHS